MLKWNHNSQTIWCDRGQPAPSSSATAVLRCAIAGASHCAKSPPPIAGHDESAQFLPSQPSDQSVAGACAVIRIRQPLTRRRKLAARPPTTRGASKCYSRTSAKTCHTSCRRRRISSSPPAADAPERTGSCSVCAPPASNDIARILRRMQPRWQRYEKNATQMAAICGGLPCPTA